MASDGPSGPLATDGRGLVSPVVALHNRGHSNEGKASMPRLYLLGGIACWLSGIAAFAGQRVQFQEAPGEIAIKVGSTPFATFVYRDEVILRPYFKDVMSPAGRRVTRHHPPKEGVDRMDHATMHPGLWLAFGDLGGADFWRNRARVVHESILSRPSADAHCGTFSIRHRYQAVDGALAQETLRIDVRSIDQGNLLVVDSAMVALRDDVYFGDQEEMGLGLRVATPLAVISGGRMIDSEGRVNESAIRGKQADWCDYQGHLDDKMVGLLLVPDPGNVSRSWYHARDYGFLAANPFGRHSLGGQAPSKVPISTTTPFRLRFAVLVHDEATPDSLRAAHDAIRGVLEKIPRP